MADKFSKEVRSKIMSHIRSKNTKPELMLKNALRGLYFRYQPKMYGSPDFALKKKKIAIFVDGCFWHKCPRCYKEPKSKKDFWIAKIERNVNRDKRTNKELNQRGWTVLRFWEHEVLENLEDCLKTIINTKNR